MFSFSSKNKKSGEVALILDIRSSSIGAGLVLIQEDETRILYTTRKDIYFSKNQQSDSFSKVSFKVLNNIMQEIEEKGIPVLSENDEIPNNISYALAMYASPWFDAKTKQVSLSRATPFKLTEKIFGRMVEEEIKQLRNRNTETVTVEKEVTNVLINGYTMTNPFHKKVTNLDFSFYVSQMAKSDLKTVENIISKSISVKKVFHKTHPLVLSTVTKNVFTNTDSFILIDIGGEITDISITKNDSLLSLATIPLGKHHFVREISTECNQEIPIAHSSFKMYFDKTSHSECSENIGKILVSMGKEWRAQLIEGLREVYSEEEIPQTIFMTTDDDAREAFKLILEDAEMKTFIGTQDSFTVNALDVSTLEGLFSYDSGVRKDLFIGMAAGYIHMINI